MEDQKPSNNFARQIMGEMGTLPPPPPDEQNPDGAAAPAATAAPVTPAAAPVTAEATAPETPAGESTESEEAAAAPAAADEEAGDQEAEPPKKPAAAAPETPPAPVVLSDDALLEELRRRGVNATSLDELKPTEVQLTAEQQEAAAQALRDEAVTYGIKNKLFSSKDLEALALENQRPVEERALEVFAAAVRKNDAELTDVQVKDLFDDYFALDLDDDHPRRLMMDREMKNLANKGLQHKFGKIIGITDTYREHAAAEQTARDYKSLVERTFEAVPKVMEFKIGERTYKYNVSPDSIEALKTQYLSTEQFEEMGSEVPNPAALAIAINDLLVAKNHTHMIETIAAAHADAILLEKAGGRRGIIPERGAAADRQDPGNTQTGYARGILQEFNNR